MALVVRAAIDADRDVLIEQFQLLNQFEDAICHALMIDRDAAVIAVDTADDYALSNDGGRLVAELDGRVVGFLYFVVRDDDLYIRPGQRRFAHVSELFVLEACRGRGISRALMDEAERLARERGAKRFTIGVLVGNDGAEAAYRAMGFAPYHTRLSKVLD
jgi:GNAT superfamily N-acetyltransferase